MVIKIQIENKKKKIVFVSASKLWSLFLVRAWFHYLAFPKKRLNFFQTSYDGKMDSFILKLTTSTYRGKGLYFVTQSKSKMQ